MSKKKRIVILQKYLVPLLSSIHTRQWFDKKKILDSGCINLSSAGRLRLLLERKNPSYNIYTAIPQLMEEINQHCSRISGIRSHYYYIQAELKRQTHIT